MNLADDPWLAASRDGAKPADHSLRDLLVRSHEFTDLLVDFPTQKPAILRQVLLPVVLHALGRPADTDEWATWFERGMFTDDQQATISDYLDQRRHLFGLFDERSPFAQVAGLTALSGETKGAALLVCTAATGNNVPLFSPRSDGDPLPLTPAQAARWLLHAHCWDTAAIKTGAVGDPKAKAGKTTGNPTGPLGQLGVVMPRGRTLFDTLLLNLPGTGALVPSDRPQWDRRAPEGPVEQTRSTALPAWQERTAAGLLELWTWQSRRIRLIPEDTEDGVRVTRVIVAAGDRLATTPDFEPHTAWTLEVPGKKTKTATGSSRPVPPRRPRRHQAGKAVWRGLDALLTLAREERAATGDKAPGYATSLLLDDLAARREDEALPADYPVDVETTGVVYGNQSAIVEDALSDAIPLPLAALREDSAAHAAVLIVVEQAEDLARALNNLSADLRRALGGEPIPWDRSQRPGDVVLHALDDLVRRLLAGLRAAGEDEELVRRGRKAWEQKALRAVWAVADRLFAGMPGAAFLGREEGESTYRIATAEAAFRRRLGRILPLVTVPSEQFMTSLWPQFHPEEESPPGDQSRAGVQPGRIDQGDTTMTERKRPPLPYWARRIGADGRWRRHLGTAPGEDLAAMRSGLGRPAGSVPSLWRFYTRPVDEVRALHGEVSDEQNAEHVALTLYGLHQQGHSDPMHKPGVRLGRALRRLRESGHVGEDALDRRVAAAASATSVESLAYRLRGLFDLLRGQAVPLDYSLLGTDLYEWHSPARRDHVRRRWGAAYFDWGRSGDGRGGQDEPEKKSFTAT
ncbi:CRISPR system Cascade subunit CasA [Actinoalloteichus hoggarensis]|uniref:CRISPR-associated protein CasA/Cse1 n=1 Tax=Actinoalloteichus hoggarensis TaxID=1470176 RepID=A0A221W9Y6_9PSEU|nr:type I-E CRISPR-associated protein Cse1/CasA [Actinoalloteichus hoggarensis]ASO22339.1 CRISPR-associated protein CasA/Cse1 [Actinoalloteichus hoggarensis]MBB5923241.1 CRISPR system Cascade subunit CasA [Actinoalloteichus hoggarensis]